MIYAFFSFAQKSFLTKIVFLYVEINLTTRSPLYTYLVLCVLKMPSCIEVHKKILMFISISSSTCIIDFCRKFLSCDLWYRHCQFLHNAIFFQNLLKHWHKVARQTRFRITRANFSWKFLWNIEYIARNLIFSYFSNINH